MADYVGGDMIRGHIDTIILNSLIDGDKDTNQIRSEIEERAGGQFQLKQGTFYSALQRIVKQGYVIEYRTTGADGVRRKFFQLTEKGKDHIDKNQSNWTVSRQVINTLLDAQAEKIAKVKESKPVEEDKLPEFDHTVNFSNLQNNADRIEESLADQVISSIDDNAYEEEIIENNSNHAENESTEDLSILTEIPEAFTPDSSNEQNNSTPQTFENILVMLEDMDKAAKEEEERIRLEEEQKLERERLIAEEKQRAEEEERLIAEQVQKERMERERNIPDVEIPDEFQIAEERTKTPIPLHNEPVDPLFSTPTEQQPESVVVEQILDQPTIQQQTFIESVVTSSEPDDFLDPDNLPSQKQYKSVLSQIFSADEKENVVEFPSVQQSIYQEQIPNEQPQEQINFEEKFDRIVDELDFSTSIENEKDKIEPEIIQPTKKSKKNSPFDYSDIIELSQKEGFKVSTSDKTNKNELGKILINRLNFHSSLIFFVLIILETLLVSLTMDSILQFGIEAYIYFSVAIFIFPMISGMLYYMAPKRTIAEVSPFKSAFETALILTLNLVLMILVYTVIIDLDFSSYQDVVKHLFLPLLTVINVPIYVIIRYSLLEKQMYFS